MRISSQNKNVKSKGDISVVIVASNFNGKVTDNLIKGAKAALKGCGVKKIKIVRVPGAFEIPVAIKSIAESGFKVDGFIALGCVIKGETAHFEYVAEPVAHSLNRLSTELVLPIGFGVLACYTPEQAYNRSRVNPINSDTNKGYETALAVVDMANLLNDINRRHLKYQSSRCE